MKTKLRLSCSFTFLFILSVAAQVGVGNTNPQAQLDISASSTSSPANSDGILIPRMSNFPSTPGATRDGMLIFYTGTGASGKGFYYYNHGTGWVIINSKDDQNLLTPNLVGTTLNLGIENGTGTAINLAPLQDGTGTDNQTIDNLSLS